MMQQNALPAWFELYIDMAPLHCFYTALFLQATLPKVELSLHQLKAGAIHTYLVQMKTMEQSV